MEIDKTWKFKLNQHLSWRRKSWKFFFHPREGSEQFETELILKVLRFDYFVAIFRGFSVSKFM